MGYTIKRSRFAVSEGRVEEILCTDGHWYREAEGEFKSLVQAKSWYAEVGRYLNHGANIMRCKMWIQGPNGGIHNLKTRIK